MSASVMPPTAFGVEEFRAVCPCPRCGEVSVHLLDHPDPDPPPPRERVLEEIRVWTGETVMVVDLDPPPPDEREWTVARECRSCSHRWGQA